MKPSVSFITLGVDNLERSLRFYRDGLGLATKGIVGPQSEYGAVVFFDLQAGLKLALWPRDSIARDSGVPLAEPSATEFTLAHNVAKREEVDAILRQAEAAGAKITKPAQPTFWGGYAGCFQDPDGHLWEIAWNPELLPRTDFAGLGRRNIRWVYPARFPYRIIYEVTDDTVLVIAVLHAARDERAWQERRG